MKQQTLVNGLLASSVLLLVACGGGGGGSAVPSTGVTTPIQPPADVSRWVQGQFPAESALKNFCANPRTGADPYNNNLPYPDKAGTAAYEKMWLRSWSNNTYLWYSELPDVDPENFTVAQYFAQLKTTAKTDSGAAKDNFHFQQNTAEYKKETEGGFTSGYGINWYVASSRPPRQFTVAYNEPDSPALKAGLPRGAQLVNVNGVDFINESSTAGLTTINAALFPAAGQSHTFTFRLTDGTQRDFNLTSADVRKVPVPQVKVLETAAGKVGYFQFNSYVAAAQPQLINAIRQFNDANIKELVVDLRYNGGGLLALSAQLGYMLAGPQVIQNRIFEKTVFNDKHGSINPVTKQSVVPMPFINLGIDYEKSQFTSETLPNLAIRRVFILTTDDTCSASEALINGLRGVDMDVVLIGGKTCGKPYGFYPTDNCGTTYFTIQFSGVNAKGFGDFADGFNPTANPVFSADVKGCAVMDDFTKPLGDSRERLLSTALHYINNNRCPVQPEAMRAIPERQLDGGVGDWQFDPRKRAMVLENKIYSPQLPPLPQK